MVCEVFMSRKELRNANEFEVIVDRSKRRIVFVMLPIFVLLILLLLCRLFYIQIMCHDEFSEAARSQYEIRLTGLDGGATSAENGCDNAATVFAVISKDRNDAALERLLRASHAENITKASSKYDVYEIVAAANEVLEELRTVYDAYVFCNYRPKQSVMTVTGEEMHSEIILYADAAGNIIGGLPPQFRVFS